MKRYLTAAVLSLTLCSPALCGTMIPDAVPPPPCDPAVEVCPEPQPSDDSEVTSTVVTVIVTTIDLINP